MLLSFIYVVVSFLFVIDNYIIKILF